MENILQNLLQPDTATVNEANAQLKSALEKESGLFEVCQILGDGSKSSDIRKTAAVALRTHFKKSKKNFTGLQPAVQQQIKESFLNLSVQDGDESVRSSITDLIGLLANRGTWPQLVPAVKTLISSNNPKEKQLGLQLTQVLCEEDEKNVMNQLMPISPDLLTCLQDQSLTATAASHCINTVANLSTHASGKNLNLFRELMVESIKVADRFLAQEEEPMWEVLELLEILIEIEVDIMSRHIKPCVELCVNLCNNENITEGIRVKAVTFLGLLTKYKKKYLKADDLNAVVITAIFQMLCGESEEENPLVGLLASDNEECGEGDDLIVSAAQALDMAAQHMQPQRVLGPLLPLVQQVFQSENPHQVKGAYCALAMIMEGCTESLTPHLDMITECVRTGITCPHIVVRNCALVLLGQMAEHFSESAISERHAAIMPFTMAQLLEVKENLNVANMQTCGRLFYALELLCEKLKRRDLESYLPQFLNTLPTIINCDTASVHIRKSGIMLLGAVAISAKQDMIPHFAPVCELLTKYLVAQTEEGDDASRLQLQSMETLAQLTRSVGKAHAGPYVGDVMELTLRHLHTANERKDPELRKTCFRLVAALASVAPALLTPHLPALVELLVGVLNSADGKPTLSNKTALKLLGEISDEGSDSEGEDEDWCVENIFTEEKEDACVTVRELAQCCKELITPFVAQLYNPVHNFISHPLEDLRMTSMLASVALVGCLLHTPEGQQHIPEIAPPLLQELLEAVVKDDCYPVASTALEAIGELFSDLGERLLVIGNGGEEQVVKSVFETVKTVFMKGTECQKYSEESSEDGDEPLEEAEIDEMLVEYAGDVFNPLGKALGPEKFGAIFSEVLKLLVSRLKPMSTMPVRSFVVGHLAECVGKLAHCVVPFLDVLLQLFTQEAKTATYPQVRSNSVFGLGEIVASGGEAVIKHIEGILELLGGMLEAGEKDNLVKDNIMGALARIVIAHPAHTPLPKIVPVLVNSFPLKEDSDENATLLEAFSALYHLQEPTFGNSLPQLTVETLLIHDTELCECEKAKKALQIFVRELHAGHPAVLQEIVASGRCSEARLAAIMEL